MTSQSTERVQEALEKKGFKMKIVQFSASTRTAEEAASAIGCSVAQIVKSLVFRTKESQKPILVLVSGVNRVNEKEIAKVVGEEIKKADAEFTREATGFAIGGIPPVGHVQKIDTYIDEDLLQYQELWAAAGTPHAVFPLDSSSIVNLTGGIVIRVK